MFLNLIFCIVFLVFLVIIIHKVAWFKLKTRSTYALILFLLKVLGAFSLWLVYTRMYESRGEADIFKYFDDSAHLYQLMIHHPVDFVKTIFGNSSISQAASQQLVKMNYWNDVFNPSTASDGRLMIIIHALIRLFSFGNFYIHQVVFCFLAFVGQFALLKIYDHKYPQNLPIAAFLLFLLPSEFLWLSGALKESFIIFIFGSVLYLLQKAGVKRYALIIILLFLLAKVRLANAVLFTVFSLYYVILFHLKSAYRYQVALGVLAILIAFTLYQLPQLKTTLHNRIILSKTEAAGGLIFQKEHTFYRLSNEQLSNALVKNKRVLLNKSLSIDSWENSLSAPKKTVLFTDTLSFYPIYYQIPLAKSSLLLPIAVEKPISLKQWVKIACFAFRPFPFVDKELSYIPFALENVLLLICFVCSIVYFVFYPNSHKVFMLWLIIFALSGFLMISLSNCVMGNIVRYKAVFIPFVTLAVMLAVNHFLRSRNAR